MPKRPARRTKTNKRGPSPAAVKLQRWIDLLAALVTHHYGLRFEDIERLVPGYAASAKATRHASLLRTFERDKDELRALGVPISMRGDAGDPEQRYFLDPRELYLPFIAIAGPRARRAGGTRPNYRMIPTLAFEPDEMDAVLRAIALAQQLGDPQLDADCDSARRKLTLDLPRVAEQEGDGSASALPHRGAQGSTLRALGNAMLRSKRVSFTYDAIGSDTTTQRTVEPFGLFLQSGHWYLAGRDVEKDAIRNFRVARITDAQANTRTPQTPDFVVPPSFRLAVHAHSRRAWELGDGNADEAIVEFHRSSGAVKAAASLGTAIRGAPRQRRFQVRRVDVFARWLLSFAGDAIPLSPPRLVDAFHAIARETLALYGGARP